LREQSNGTAAPQPSALPRNAAPPPTGHSHATTQAAAIMDNVGSITSKFFWSHHTFTHENLDNATY
jgi:hypothetical protein